MKTIADFIDRLNDRVGRFAKYLITILLFVTLFEVVMRRVFGSPTIWGFELSSYLFGLFFMLSLGYTHLQKGHVTIDVFEERLSPSNRAVLRIVTFALFFVPFVGVISWQSVRFAQCSWSQWEHSATTWKPAIYPIKTIMPLAFGLLLLQGFAGLLRDIRRLRKGADDGA